MSEPYKLCDVCHGSGIRPTAYHPNSQCEECHGAGRIRPVKETLRTAWRSSMLGKTKYELVNIMADMEDQATRDRHELESLRELVASNGLEVNYG